FDGLASGPEHLEPRVFLVVRRDDRPRRILGARAPYHVARGTLVGCEVAAVLPILLVDLEALERLLPAVLEALQLLVLADSEPELVDDHSRFGELQLERVDLIVSAAPVRLGREAPHPLDEHAPVPGTIEDREPAALRQVAPETPQVRAREL